MSFMQMIFIDSDDHARQTGVGAQFATPTETWKAFNSAKPHAVAIERAQFLLDYHNRRGDLSDTIPISRESFEAITGESVKTDAEYREIDRAFWAEIEAQPRRGGAQ